MCGYAHTAMSKHAAPLAIRAPRTIGQTRTGMGQPRAPQVRSARCTSVRQRGACARHEWQLWRAAAAFRRLGFACVKHTNLFFEGRRTRNQFLKASPFPDGATSNTCIYYIRCVHVTPVRVLIVAVLGRSFLGESLTSNVPSPYACNPRLPADPATFSPQLYIRACSGGAVCACAPSGAPDITCPDPALPCCGQRGVPHPQRARHVSPRRLCPGACLPPGRLHHVQWVQPA